MFLWDPDMQKVLYTTIKNTFPFLINAPEEFREELRARVAGLAHYCRQGNLDKLNEEVKIIDGMITNYNFGPTINTQIYYLQNAITPLYESMEDLDRRMHEIERWMKTQNKKTPKKLNSRLDVVNYQSNEGSTKIPYPLTTEFIEGIGSNERKISKVQGIFDYLKMRTPDYVVTDEIAGYLGTEPKYVATEIVRIMTSHKHADAAKHIEIVDNFRKSPTDRLRKAYRWVNEIN
jgi:hypothetical protein